MNSKRFKYVLENWSDEEFKSLFCNNNDINFYIKFVSGNINYLSFNDAFFSKTLIMLNYIQTSELSERYSGSVSVMVNKIMKEHKKFSNRETYWKIAGFFLFKSSEVFLKEIITNNEFPLIWNYRTTDNVSATNIFKILCQAETGDTFEQIKTCLGQKNIDYFLLEYNNNSMNSLSEKMYLLTDEVALSFLKLFKKSGFYMVKKEIIFKFLNIDKPKTFEFVLDNMSLEYVNEFILPKYRHAINISKDQFLIDKFKSKKIFVEKYFLNKKMEILCDNKVFKNTNKI